MAYEFCLVFLLVMLRWRKAVGILRSGNDGFDPLPLLLYALQTPLHLMALPRTGDREKRVRIELGKRRLWNGKFNSSLGQMDQLLCLGPSGEEAKGYLVWAAQLAGCLFACRPRSVAWDDDGLL